MATSSWSTASWQVQDLLTPAAERSRMASSSLPLAGSWRVPVPELLTPAADRSRISRQISGDRRNSTGTRSASEVGEFGEFLAAEFDSLQNRVLARLEQDLAGGGVQRYANKASRKTSLIGARHSDSSLDEGSAIAKWGRLVAVALDADADDNIRNNSRNSRNSHRMSYASDPDELWAPHPDWQAMTSPDAVRDSAKAVLRPTRSMLVDRLFVDQLQTTYCGTENGGLGMFEKSGNSWLSRHVVHPDGARAICWCFVGMILMCYETVTIPLEAVGLNEKPSTALAVAILVYWMLDLPHHALTGYMHDVTLEMRASYTLRHYAKTWMAIDLALVSGDLAFLVLDTRGTAQTLKLLRLLRMARLVRIRRWRSTFKALMIGRQYEMAELILRLAGLVLSLLVICHLLACMWYHLGDQLPGGDGSWLDDGNLRSEDNRRKYAAAFHWTITQFTPSTNNIGPQTTEERCFAIAVVIMGMVVFSTFLGMLSKTVDEMRSYGSNSQLVQERHRLLVFTKQRGLTHVISQKILAFFDTEKTRQSHVATEADLPVIAQLPKAVQMGLRAELYIPSLRLHPLFSVIATHDATFCVNLSFKCMSEERYMAQQFVFVDGVHSDITYITRSGLIEYVYESMADGRVSFSVTSGSWLAECALWVRWTHRGLLLAHSSASLVTMDCAAMRSLVEMHSPDLRVMLKCFAILFAHEMDINGNGKLATDLAPPADFLKSLTLRAASFTASQFPGLPSGVTKAGRAAPPRSDGRASSPVDPTGSFPLNNPMGHMVSKLITSAV